MRNLLLGFLFGLLLATGLTTYAQSVPGISPYAPSQLMGETNLYNALISADTDAYLLQKYGTTLPQLGSGVPCLK